MIAIRDILRFLDEEKIDYTFTGDDSASVDGFSPLSDVKANSLTWVKSLAGFDPTALAAAPGLLVVPRDGSETGLAASFPWLACDTPRATFFSILNRFFSPPRVSGISSTAVVETDRIGKDVFIGHHSYIGPDVTIGDRVTIHHNVTIENTVSIGDDSVLYSGVVIGTDGFGQFPGVDGRNTRVTHFGGVRIGSRVEIGANCCIDRGTLADTVIEDDARFDNLVHVGHNVHIGRNSLIMPLTVFSGSVHLGENTYIAPASAIRNQLTIGAGGFVGMGAVVVKDVPENMVVAGVPAKVIRERRPGE